MECLHAEQHCAPVSWGQEFWTSVHGLPRCRGEGPLMAPGLPHLQTRHVLVSLIGTLLTAFGQRVSSVWYFKRLSSSTVPLEHHFLKYFLEHETLENPVKPKHRLARRNTQTHIKRGSNPAGGEEPLSAEALALRCRGGVEMLLCLRLSSGSAHLEPAGQVWVWAPGKAHPGSGQLHHRTSLFCLLLALVWNVSGSCCLLVDVKSAGTELGCQSPPDQQP